MSPTMTPTGTPTPTANGAKITAPKSETLKSVGIGLGLSSTKTFTIKNSGKKGAGDLIGTIAINPVTSPTVFSIAPTSFDVPVGKTAVETVTFTPDPASATTAYTATAVITSNASNGTVSVALKGAGLPGKLTVPKTFAPKATVGTPSTANLTFKNAGKGALSGSWTGVSTPPYSVTAGTFGPLQPGATSTIPVTFTPTAKGPGTPTATITITVAAPSTGTATVTLKGVGALPK